MNKIAYAKELRNNKEYHYHCCQSVVLPFAKEFGYDETQITKMISNFGGGMKMGSVCGAAAGGLIVLGMYGKNTKEDIQDFYTHFQETNHGYVNCKDLLLYNSQTDIEKREFCNQIIYTTIAYLEKVLPSVL